MNNVIHYTFPQSVRVNGGGPIPATGAVITALPCATDRIVQDAVWFVGSEPNKQRVKLANYRACEITDVIFGVEGFCHQNQNVHSLQEELKTRSIEELAAIILDSGRAEWRLQPHYYGAAILEIADRSRQVFNLISWYFRGVERKITI
ncbi:MAG TPA: hypothetical protein VGE31_02630 [Candidatus Paceibacterota bacterium]